MSFFPDNHERFSSDSDERPFLESISSITNVDCFDERRDIISEHAASIANVFWRSQLTFSPYVHGDAMLNFGDLWPEGDQLSSILECFRGEEMRGVAIDCCKLVLRCGPIQVLDKMLKLNIIDINDVFDNGRTLLHVACLACNQEAVSFLREKGINLKLKDNSGLTADQVCFDRETRRLLPSKGHSSLSRSVKRKSSTFDRNVFFDLCDKPSLFDELQTHIQTQEFNVSEDANQQGDLLIHSAVRGGISQLSLLINLVKVHGADVEAANKKTGMTALCLATKLGLEVIADVLICILGADPNKRNTINGWTPLHYAAKGNHLETVSCLLKRGADVNIEFNVEDYCLLPDDLAGMHKNRECQAIIEEHREKRCARLTHLAFLGNLCPKDIRLTDLYNIDSGGKTLVMAAAAGNRCDNLNILFKYKDCPVNAQNVTSGATALAYASLNGHLEAVQTLFDHGAMAGIRDIAGLLPLHYACKGGHTNVVREFVSRNEGLTGLFEALDVCPSDNLKALIHAGMEKRQKQLVNPVLFECSMNGDAGKVYCLLEDGDDVNPLTSGGDWPVYMAVGNGHIEVLKLLHERGGDIFRVHPQTHSTLLHIACSRGLTEITGYLLNFCQSFEDMSLLSDVATGPLNTAIDINAVNSHGLTALQLAASKGFTEIVKLLLNQGASSAVLSKDGVLYHCEQYEGVQAVIENHRKSRTDNIMLSIKDKKRFKYLQKHWQPKFDHNLRDRLANTPLMSSCLFGRVPVVKFLLETSVQNLGDVTFDFEKSMRLRYDSQSDSRGFLESYSSVMNGTQTDNFESSITDYSDQENGAPSVVKLPPRGGRTSTPRNSREDLRKYRIPEEEFPNKYICQKSISTETENPPGEVKRRTRNGFWSDSEVSKNQEGERQNGRPHGKLSRKGRDPFRPSLASIRSASLSSLQQDLDQPATPGDVKSQTLPNPPNETLNGSLPVPSTTLGYSGYVAALVEADEKETDVSQLYVNHFSTDGPLLFQGNVINHLCAVNPYDGRSAIHRAVECTDKRAGHSIMALLLKKDPEIVNLQDRDGFTALHLACQLERKQIVKKLLNTERINLNLRTLDGRLPEEMTTTASIRKLLRKARENFSEPVEGDEEVRAGRAVSEITPTVQSTIDFEKLNKRFNEKKESAAT